jgi:uncharacterized protein YbjT (DUF2867 family)
MKKVLVAGATGYLGKYLVKALYTQGHQVRAIARTPEKLDDLKDFIDKIIKAEITQPDTMKGICTDTDVVISSIGITRQKDGLKYMDVDYQANKNLLNEAITSGAKKFIYVSVLNGRLFKNLKMIEAKERFADDLMASGLDYTIIRPNGFFSDIKEVLNMAMQGKVYLIGDGHYKSNPIHGQDLAEFIVGKMDSSEKEIDVGGPEIFTQNEIAGMAFRVLGKKEKITHISIWIRDISLKLMRLFTGQKTYGPFEFFMTVMTHDMIAPQVGREYLKNYFIANIKKGAKFEIQN